jgi:hypothetical protein
MTETRPHPLLVSDSSGNVYSPILHSGGSSPETAAEYLERNRISKLSFDEQQSLSRQITKERHEEWLNSPEYAEQEAQKLARRQADHADWLQQLGNIETRRAEDQLEIGKIDGCILDHEGTLRQELTNLDDHVELAKAKVLAQQALLDLKAFREKRAGEMESLESQSEQVAALLHADLNDQCAEWLNRETKAERKQIAESPLFDQLVRAKADASVKNWAEFKDSQLNAMLRETNAYRACKAKIGEVLPPTWCVDAHRWRQAVSDVKVLTLPPEPSEATANIEVQSTTKSRKKTNLCLSQNTQS